jgi:hypothetical protein
MDNETIKKCLHRDMHYNLDLHVLGDTNLCYLEVTGKCKLCDEDVIFRGPAGVSKDQATVSIDGKTAHLPLVFGEHNVTGNPVGFSVRRMQ